MNLSPRARSDLALTLAALVLLLAWDFSGWDLAAAQAFGNAQGFAWRDNFVASTVLHDGGRVLAWVLMGALVVAAVRTRPGSPGPTRAERWRWNGVILLCVLLVPALKRFSRTSCPWDLAEFGGTARHVSHWAFGVADGGGGHCFPSGHAVAAFAFFGLYFLWRGHDTTRARAWLWGVGLVGSFFGLAQLARGAHYPSHTAWSAWLCWTLCLLAWHVMERRKPTPAAA